MESLKRDYVVYKHTAQNGKCYIGINGQNPPENSISPYLSEAV